MPETDQRRRHGDIGQSIDGISSGQVFTGLALILREVRTEDAQALGCLHVNTGRGVVGLRVAVEALHAGIVVIGAEVDAAVLRAVLRSKSEESKDAILHQRSADDEAGLDVAGVIFLGLVVLRVVIEARRIGRQCSHGVSHRTVRIEAGIGRRRAVQEAGFRRNREGAMPAVGATFHEDVDHATQSTAMLGFNTRGLDLHFLNELKGDIGMRIAANQVGRVLAFHQVRVLRVCAAGNRETETAAVTAVARRGAARAGSASSAIGAGTRQRLIAGRRCKLNHRLERTSVRNILNHVRGHVGGCRRGCNVNQRSRRRHFHNGLLAAHLQGEFQARQVADLDRDALTLERGEARRLHGDSIHTGRQVGETIVARRIGGRSFAANQRGAGQLDLRLRYQGSLFVLHCALQAARGFLGEAESEQEGHHDGQCDHPAAKSENFH